MNRFQVVPREQRYTVKDFNAMYPDDSACLEWVKEQRWPDGRTLCVVCKVERKHYRVSGRTAYACWACGNHIHPLAGTIFHKSSTSLRTWFYVIKLMTSTRVGISAKRIQRETGVTYKCAWRMMKQVRKLMAEQLKLYGPVEMDEAYFGGKLINKHRNKLKQGTHKDKQPVFGMVERGGRVVAIVTTDAKEKTILPIIAERVLPASTVYTDCYTTYDHLGKMPQGYDYQKINHAEYAYLFH